MIIKCDSKKLEVYRNKQDSIISKGYPIAKCNWDCDSIEIIECIRDIIEDLNISCEIIEDTDY